MFQIANGTFKLSKLEAKKAAITELRDFFRVDHQHHVDNRERFIKGMRFQINLFQIVQHAPENLPIRDTRQKAFIEFDGIAVSFKKPFAAIVTRQDLAAIEGIEKKFFPPVRIFHDEVAWHSHSDNWK